ncbi:hypothetical protein MUK42_36155 [Musa troglodytarum]|uniref:Secreted protein n=1 Tax=Musa troglodytarum TaxID=320322 RepID=A0A9E7I592_9LILI|nr:hypothetical protein MUK42_36155 [Musa troglodytarum]
MVWLIHRRPPSRHLRLLRLLSVFAFAATHCVKMVVNRATVQRLHREACVSNRRGRRPDIRPGLLPGTISHPFQHSQPGEKLRGESRRLYGPYVLRRDRRSVLYELMRLPQHGSHAGREKGGHGPRRRPGDAVPRPLRMAVRCSGIWATRADTGGAERGRRGRDRYQHRHGDCRGRDEPVPRWLLPGRPACAAGGRHRLRRNIRGGCLSGESRKPVDR